MSEDGGPSEQAKLRERFAVAIAGNADFWTAAMGALHKTGAPREAIETECARLILDMSQLCADEAMERRKQDNAKRLAEGGDEVKT